MKKVSLGREELKALSAALRRVDFFADLSARDLEHVFAVTSLYSFKSGHTVFKKGAVGDALYMIHKGEVDILLPRILLPSRRVARLGSGDVFGEMALIEQSLRTATAVTRGETQLFVILKPHFDDIVASNPDFAYALKKVASKRAFEVKDRFGA